MRTPEEYNEIFFTTDQLDLVDLITEIQKEAWNEAIESAAESAKVLNSYCYEADGTVSTFKLTEVDEQSILKLKK